MTSCHCGDQAQARGLCHKHYMQWRRAKQGPLAATWDNMVQRCTNPNHPRYHRYGGRGITVDPSWLGPEGYKRFAEYMGERPPDPEGWASKRPYYSLDRIDNDGPYAPGNVRWATITEQAYNRAPSLRLAA